MYSVAASPSGMRAAPAKKRNRSTHTVISSIAAPTGLPAFWLSSRPSSSARASRASAIFRRSSERSWGVVFFHVANALSAAFTARSTSSDALGRHVGDDLAVRRVLDLERLAARRVDERAVDQLLVGLDALHDVGHLGLLPGVEAGSSAGFRRRGAVRARKSQGAGTILAHGVVSDQPEA